MVEGEWPYVGYYSYKNSSCIYKSSWYQLFYILNSIDSQVIRFRVSIDSKSLIGKRGWKESFIIKTCRHTSVIIVWDLRWFILWSTSYLDCWTWSHLHHEPEWHQNKKLNHSLRFHFFFVGELIGFNWERSWSKMMDGIKKRNLKVKILSDRSSLSREMMGLFK